MKKKILLAALSVFILAAMTSCVFDVRVVEDEPEVSSVTVTKTTDNRYYIVTWTGIAGADSYRVYAQQNGKNSMLSLGTGQNTYVYSQADAGTSANTNSDAWSFRYLASNLSAGLSIKFGVQANNVIGNWSKAVKWSSAITTN